MSAAALLDALRTTLGTAHVLVGTDAAGYLTDQHGRLTGQALAVVRPADTHQVAEVVRLCRQYRTPIVAQGGNTGLMGGATPDTSGQAIVLLLGRLNRIRHIDTDNDTLIVEAGAILANVQQAAREAGRLFALSLGSQGSCTIGGNLATNAGGTQVLRYGNARELTLGLEVVTAEGAIWDGLRGLRKDNTGYALRDLYVGSEGTLGIITAATLKLHPLPAAQQTALLAFASIEAALSFLNLARAGFGAGLTAFELLSDAILGLVAQHVPEQPLPLALDHPWYALIELSDSQDDQHARTLFEKVLSQAMEDGIVQDAALAHSSSQHLALWRLRDEALGVAQKRDGGNVKHDISLPISRIPAFLTATAAALQAGFPGVRPVAFGHLGDGNLHYNVSHALSGTAAELFAVEDQIHAIVHDSVHAHAGSISAEHGIGQTKRDLLPRYKSAVELDLMRRLKTAFDPLGLLNPAKILTLDHRSQTTTMSQATAPIVLSPRVSRVKLSPNAAAAARAAALAAEGRDIISLTTGEPDFDTPEAIKQAAIAALARGETKYTPTPGTLGLRRAVSRKYLNELALEYGTGQIIISNGGKQVIYSAFAATLAEGDEVIIPTPYWPSFPDMVLVNDGVPVLVACGIETGYKLSAAALEAAITPRTRWLVLNTPGNPSGAVYDRDELAALAEVLRRHPQVLVLLDELYEHIWFTPEAPVHWLHVAPDLKARTLLVSGASKTYAMTGWRIGWGAGPERLVQAMVVIQSQVSSGPNAIAQAATQAALESPDQEFAVQARHAYARRARLVEAAIATIPGLALRRIDGSFFAFVHCAGLIGQVRPDGQVIASDQDAVQWLLESEGLALVDGAAFGLSPYLRLSTAAADAVLEEAMRRLKRAVSALRAASRESDQRQAAA